MKKLITPSLLQFTLAALVLTVFFRLGFSYSITHKILLGMMLVPAFYGLLMGFTGYYFGRKEYKQLPLHDTGFRFHLATFITHNGVSLVWFFLALHSKYEKIAYVYYTALIWSIFLLIHLVWYIYAKRSTIKGFHKEDIFE